MKNFFLNLSKKTEELKPSLSKQHNKMLKIRSEMLKIRKNGKIIKLEKNSRENFPEIFRNPEIPRIFVIFGKFFVSGKLKIREKEKLYAPVWSKQ